MNGRNYLFHGLNLGLAGEPRVLDALHSRLRWFPAGFADRDFDLHFEYVRDASGSPGAAGRPAGNGRVILDFGNVQALYFERPQQLYMEAGPHGRMLCDIVTRRATIAYPESEEAEPWLLSHLLFTVPLAELLKRLGLYMAHAAGVAANGKGLLIAGESGAGKTTLAIALARAGFAFLADDTLFLSTSNGLRALAFPDEIDITPQTAAFFPELRRPNQDSVPAWRGKRPISPGEVCQAEPCWECKPAIMVFPQPARSPESTLAPMPKDHALLELVCNVLRTEPRSAQAHLDALAALVKQCRCYRLQTGRDFDKLAVILRGMVNSPESKRATPRPR
jgi:hypothetical protein